jgi:hypothetical protein
MTHAVAILLVAEQNRNERSRAWEAELMTDGTQSHVFPTEAASLAYAATSVVTLVDREA